MDYAEKLKIPKTGLIICAAATIITGGVAVFGVYKTVVNSFELPAIEAQLTRQQEETTGLETAVLERWKALGLPNTFPAMETKDSANAYCANPQLFTPESRGVKDSQLCDKVGKLILASGAVRPLSAEYKRLNHERAGWLSLGMLCTFVSLMSGVTYIVERRAYKELTKQPA